MPANAITVSTSPIVLLGSSNPSMIECLAGTLESWHYQVDLAKTGADALARIDSDTPPPIALLDMDLPTPSAVEIVWEIRRRQQQRRTWNILLSDHTDRDRIRAALQCGCDDYLVFPCDAKILDSTDLKVRIRVAERVIALTSSVQKQSAEVRYHLTHDGLTGLWNREALLSLVFQETDRVQRMKTPLSLMVLDLDDFSRINHDYGYETGDAVLIELATRFRRQLRTYDLIGRSGEDEFLLALPGCNLEEAVLLAGRIRDNILGRPFPVDNETTSLTASVGIAISHGRSPLVVLREAERALAEAKLSGKNCVRGDAPEAYLLQPALAANSAAAGD
ncbi:MAG TPA: GGDEF domain-containing response regulator [Acidobacteriaceae bacterium]|nr:GGDEF domain-containing response regulator [Acidobacteriaceae bacterium]